MIVKDPGHDFLLDVLDGYLLNRVRLTFVKREGPHYPGNVGYHPGTTTQEVLRALINRAQYVNSQIPCFPTRASIWLMRLIIFLHEWRAKRVKGKWLSPRNFAMIEHESTCVYCGHIRCTEPH